MFAEIAEFVIKRHKLIIIAWIIVLILALPLAPLVGSVVQYEETSMAPDSLESTQANNFIKNTFGSSSDQPTTIIVLTSSDILNNESKQVAISLESNLKNASLYGDINKASVTSIYSVTKTYTLNILFALNGAYVQANQTAEAIYGLPQGYRLLWQEANLTAHAFYDLPRDYSATWSYFNSTHPGSNTTQVDALTYQAVKNYLGTNYQNLTSEQRSFLFGWLSAFSAAWNDTSSSPLTPDQRSEYAHALASDPFITSLPVSDQDKTFLRSVNATFAGQNISFSNVSDFCVPVYRERVNATLANVPVDQRLLVSSYLNATYAWWSSLTKEPTTSLFDYGVSSTALNFGQNITDPSTKYLFLQLGGQLNYSKFNVPVTRRTIVSNVVASIPSMAQQISPEPWLVAVAGDLGPDVPPSKILALSAKIVSNSTLAEYPIKIPTDVMRLFVSPSNTTMLITLTYDKIEGNADPGRADVGKIREIVASATSGTGVKPYVTGSDPINVDLQASTWEDLRIIEPVTIVLILVLIGLFFRSIVASSVPPMVIGVALGISYALVYLIGAYLMNIHYSVLTLMLTSMLGAGCDYCIFIMSRYREERHNGRNKNDSVRQAVNWAGESIATSGATVIIGFGVLATGRFGMMQSIGVALAIGVTIALLVALTLLPSLLMLLGNRMFWPARIDRPIRVRNKIGYFTKSAHFAIRHAKVIVVAAILISVPATYLVLTMETSYDFIGSMGESESKAGLDAMGEGFGEGRVNPTRLPY
jgi:predicted RND superfamily exporter protein